MPLAAVITGQQQIAINVNQLINLLTGVMTDQAVTIANSLTANTLKPAGITGSVAATRFVGGTATGAPTTGTFLIGDYVIAQDGFVWICIGAGTPGTWKLGGADLAALAPLNAAAAAAVGTSLKAAREDHVHSWSGLGVLANAQTWAAIQTFSAKPVFNAGLTVVAGPSLSIGVTSMVEDGSYLNFVGNSVRPFYVNSSFPTTYIYSATIYLGDGSNAANVIHFRNSLLDGTSWSMTAAGALTVASVVLSGALTAGSLVLSGSITGATTGAFSGILTAASLVLTGVSPAGSITGATTGAFSGALTAASATLTGALAAVGATFGGTAISGTSWQIRGDGVMLSASWNGSAWAGTQYQHPMGWGSQCRTLFTANTRSDANAQEGDLLFNA